MDGAGGVAVGRVFKPAAALKAPRSSSLLRAGDLLGTTRYVAFDTAKTVFATRADKCHVSHVAVRLSSAGPSLAPGDLLNLIVEVTGEGRKDKAAKVAAARNLWIPAVNNHGGFGRWAFVEVTDPWDAVGVIRGAAEAVATT